MRLLSPAQSRGGARPLGLTAAIAVAVAVVGCNSDGGSHAAPSPSLTTTQTSPPAIYPGWSLHTDAGGGFAVALPDQWEHAQRDSPTLRADLAAIAARSAELGRYFETSLGSADNHLEFLAADPSSLPTGFATNAAVFRTALGNPATAAALVAITQAKIKVLRQDGTISRAIDSKHVHIAGRDADRLAYFFKSGTQAVAVVSYLLVTDAAHKRIEYELVLGTAIADYAALFDRISSSFRVVPQTAPATASPSD